MYGEFRDYKPWFFIGAGREDKHRKFLLDLKKKDKIDNILFKEADEILKKFNLKSFVKLKRAYASGYTHGTIHDLHQDEGAMSYNEIFTIMFYLNKSWDVTFAGETIFYYGGTETIQSILPRPGRAVLFDGSIPHMARDPSRVCSDLRIIATFKYEVRQ